MVFSSSTFIFMFLPIVLIGYYLINPQYRNIFLLIVSLGFYAFTEPRFVLILILSIVINYTVGVAIDRIESAIAKKIILLCGIIIDLLILCVFKYTNFLTINIHRIWVSMKITNIALPVGISFFTFQEISYIVDVYRGEEVQNNPLNLGLYISFFPQLIAGPIVRYKMIAQEINQREHSWNEFSEGIVIFICGFAKKIILSNNMSIIADKAFAGDLSNQSIAFVWLGAFAYTYQIYFDFSGYSDMAIGLGRMFGFHFPQNFNYPYASKNITDFWRRCHISLGTWFRDYIYIPLGGSRKGDRKTIRNLLVVWLLTGLWHGAGWTFIIWGLSHFVMLVMEKYVIHPSEFKKNWISQIYGFIIFIFVTICWVIFRSQGMTCAIKYLKAMFGLYHNQWIDSSGRWYFKEYASLFLLSILLSVPFVRNLISTVKTRINPILCEVIRVFVYTSLFVVSISYLVIGAHNPFIYFNF